MASARARVWIAALLVLGGLLALRLVRIELDAPDVVLPYFADEAHFRDEAAKGHEARNMARFDRWQLHDADEYGFWRLQSPYWVYTEAAWLRAFGVDLVSARMFVFVHVAVSLALLFWLALRRHGLAAACAATLLLGASWPYLVYSRLALMEAVVIAWLVVATFAIAQLEGRPEHSTRWVAFGAIAMLLACGTKQTALLVVPVYVGIVLRATWRRPGFASAAAIVGSLVAVLAVVMLDPEYQRRLAFNAEHFTRAKAHGESAIGSAAHALTHGVLGRLGLMFFVVAPVPLWLSVVEVARFVVARRRAEAGTLGLGGRLALVDLWMLAWAAAALLANLASTHRAIRFQLVLLPPAAWLGGLLIARLWDHAWPRRAAVRAAIVLLLVGDTAVTLVRFVDWMRTSESTAADLGGPLTVMIGDRDAVVVGEFAAQAVFATSYRHFYVRPGQFNDDRATILALGITHLVAAREERDFVLDTLRRKTPELLERRREIGSLRFRGRELVVWALR